MACELPTPVVPPEKALSVASLGEEPLMPCMGDMGTRDSTARVSLTRFPAFLCHSSCVVGRGLVATRRYSAPREGRRGEKIFSTPRGGQACRSSWASWSGHAGERAPEGLEMAPPELDSQGLMETAVWVRKMLILQVRVRVCVWARRGREPLGEAGAASWIGTGAARVAAAAAME